MQTTNHTDPLAKMLGLMDAVETAETERRPLTRAERKLLPSGDWQARADRYLAINRWLKNRYTENGWLTISVGANPTVYSRLDLAFFRRYVLD